MAYSTEADIKKLISLESLVQLTDDEGLNIVDQGRVTEAIADADAEIDAYCAGRYTVPFSTVPAVIKKLSVDIAVYNLYSRCPSEEETPPVRQERYKYALKMLESISKGTITLGVFPEPTGGTEQIKSSRTKADRTFSTGKTSDGTSGSLDNY